MEGAERTSVQGSDCNLSIIETGVKNGPVMILIHGMRDHALSLIPIAKEFAGEFRVILPDLRGHGDSDNSGSYAMMQFVADLRSLVEEMEITHPLIVGHSLGGHIASRYASIYSEEVRGLVLLDGMGPPRSGDSKNEKDRQDARESIRSLMMLSSELGSMPSSEEALLRLKRNNPLLGNEAARIIVEYGVEPHPEGGVRWKWDPRVNMVWNTFSHDESEEEWRFIKCPVLIVTGDRALDYWAQRRPELGEQQKLHDDEIERRRQLFADAHSVTLANAGHMLHYDQPDDLNQVLRGFVDKLAISPEMSPDG